MVEAPVLRPMLERARRTLLPVRRHVPLAKAPGHIPVVLQDPRNRGATLRHGTRIARERPRELGNRAHTDPVLVAPGERRRPRRRAQRHHMEPVIGETHLPDARQVRRRHRPAERVGLTEPGIIDQDQQDVRCALRRLWPGMIVQSGTD